MATVTTKKCDVCGLLEAKAVDVTVQYSDGPVEMSLAQDMCPRCIERLCNFVRRGMKASTPRKRDAKPDRTPPAPAAGAPA